MKQSFVGKGTTYFYIAILLPLKIYKYFVGLGV